MTLSSLVCGLLLLTAVAAEPAGLTVRDGQLLKDGRPYRAFGLNVRDLADEILDQGAAAKDSFECLKWLGQKRVPFIRFWGSYFNNRKKYLANPEVYWQHMDLLVAACEEAHVGLAPTLFWDSWQVPWTFGEHCEDWGNPQSQTRQFAERYVREFVTRYQHRPIVWLWEFSNENNLMWDLPNTMQFLPKDQQDRRNIARSSVGRESITAFAQTVRQYDTTRPISSGCSAPRGSQFHLNAVMDAGQGHPWQADSPAETATAAGWTAAGLTDLLCIHHYLGHLKYDGAALRRDLQQYLAISRQLRKPLYIGEFGVLDGQGQLAADFDATAYQAHARDMFQALYETQVPLACWWVYAVKPHGFGMGAVNPVYGKFDYIVDLLAEYNDKIASASGGRPNP